MSPRAVIAIFCEDVREEVGGTHSIIGVMPDNIEVASFPGMLPKLAIYIRISLGLDVNVGSLAFKLRFPDGAEKPLGAFDTDELRRQQELTRSQGGPKVGLIVKAVAQGLKLQAAGRILIIADIAGEEEVCGSLNIKASAQANPSASASAPHA
jgi:hypothetical protein